MKHASANSTSCSKRSDTDSQLFVEETTFLSSSGYWIKDQQQQQNIRKLEYKENLIKPNNELMYQIAMHQVSLTYRKTRQ